MNVEKARDYYETIVQMKERENGYFERGEYQILHTLQNKTESLFYASLEELEISVEEFEKKLNEKYMRMYFVEHGVIKFEFKDGIYNCVDSHMVELLEEIIKEKGG